MTIAVDTNTLLDLLIPGASHADDSLALLQAAARGFYNTSFPKLSVIGHPSAWSGG